MGYSHFRYARRVDADTISLHLNDLTSLVSIHRPASTKTKISAGATNDLLLDGANGVWMSDTGVNFFRFYEYSSDDIISGQTSNNDLYLFPQGTGVVKFGTYSAGVAGDSTGYIPIKDKDGNTRKLMVQA